MPSYISTSVLGKSSAAPASRVSSGSSTCSQFSASSGGSAYNCGTGENQLYRTLDSRRRVDTQFRVYGGRLAPLQDKRPFSRLMPTSQTAENCMSLSPTSHSHPPLWATDFLAEEGQLPQSMNELFESNEAGLLDMMMEVDTKLVDFGADMVCTTLSQFESEKKLAVN
ncbi:hypothetical protein Ciccas_009460 [Cichlidogyrus casuarinus]|uniref:Uncharacterized protein n=1 Tax=Cichlidogyrus casuarinus TaxID=1844966 RepID=A0ABD2PXY6_9PLAT